MDGFSGSYQLRTWEQAVRYARWLACVHGHRNPNHKAAVAKLRRPSLLPWQAGWRRVTPKADR